MLVRLSLALLALACVPSRVSAQPLLRVLPLGDSITECNDGDATYRYFLWHAMLQAGCPVDLVGSKRGVLTGSPRHAVFDQDHEGHWGKRVDELLPYVRGWAAAAAPDIVLLHLGTNDLLQGQSAAGTVTELGTMIDALRAAQPDVVVLLAQVIPVAAYLGVAVEPLNAALPALAAGRTTARSPVVLVDQYTGFDPVRHTYDGIHPNLQGEQRMAGVWFQQLAAVLAQRLATFETFGSGCAGTLGAAPALAALTRPRIGRAFALAATRLTDGSGFALGLLGRDDQRWAGGSLPLSLGAAGMPGCALRVAPEVGVLLPKAGGTAVWALPIPDDASLVGVEFYQQVLDARPGANAAGLVLSPGGRARIGVK